MARESGRKTPEQLLREVQAEEAAAGKGHLKIFLGYASGVGKSFRMLDEARRRRERGQDVVVGAVQPRVPPEVEALRERFHIDSLAADDLRRRLPRFQDENLRHNLGLISRLEDVAAATGRSSSQLALAWLLAKGPDIVPIPGTKRRTYLESNAAAAELELTRHEVNALDAAFPPDAARGERYAPDLMRWLDRTPAPPTVRQDVDRVP